MMPLPDVLTVADVLKRYGLRDKAAARRFMREVGAFTVGGRLVVRQDDLDRWEREQAEIARRAQQPVKPVPAPQARRSSRSGQEPLAPGWWRADETDAA